MSTITAETAARAAAILAEWDAAEAAEAARVAAHYAWVDHMVDVERIRRETLPCHHGTSFWPDFGQVCSGCEAEAEAESYGAEPTQEEREAAALQQALREAELAAQPNAWAGGYDPAAPF